MNVTIEQQIRALEQLSAVALRARYRELFGEESRSGNRQFLFRRVAWRMQAMAEGDLSERARKRALEIASDHDLRVLAPKRYRRVMGSHDAGDPRLPQPGTVLRRKFRDRQVEVTVRENGFDFEGRLYSSLSSCATAIAGTRWNGYAFFGLNGERRAG